MEQITQNELTEEPAKKSNLGGARPGAGRRKGSVNKISAKQLLEAADQVLGKPFVVSVLEGYHDSILNGDRHVRVKYEKMILDKVIADKQEIEVTNSDELLNARAEAFKEALSELTKRDKKS